MDDDEVDPLDAFMLEIPPEAKVEQVEDFAAALKVEKREDGIVEPKAEAAGPSSPAVKAEREGADTPAGPVIKVENEDSKVGAPCRFPLDIKRLGLQSTSAGRSVIPHPSAYKLLLRILVYSERLHCSRDLSKHKGD